MWNINEASAEDKTKNRYIQELTLRFIASNVLGLFALHSFLILEELPHRTHTRVSFQKQPVRLASFDALNRWIEVWNIWGKRSNEADRR